MPESHRAYHAIEAAEKHAPASSERTTFIVPSSTQTPASLRHVWSSPDHGDCDRRSCRTNTFNTCHSQQEAELDGSAGAHPSGTPRPYSGQPQLMGDNILFVDAARALVSSAPTCGPTCRVCKPTPRHAL